ncbi:hypothetical protein C8D95_10636 [Silicimonas algicola]|uniref:Phage integrase family protein n=1 Tax=Silicimonas algicola TaxID=1826607 RepID=A0A316G3X6_9RHOB|nr:hypothetical protein C8D95_10636 [Silicimonas algicola]
MRSDSSRTDLSKFGAAGPGAIGCGESSKSVVERHPPRKWAQVSEASPGPGGYELAERTSAATFFSTASSATPLTINTGRVSPPAPAVLDHFASPRPPKKREPCCGMLLARLSLLVDCSWFPRIDSSSGPRGLIGSETCRRISRADSRVAELGAPLSRHSNTHRVPGSGVGLSFCLRPCSFPCSQGKEFTQTGSLQTASPARHPLFSSPFPLAPGPCHQGLRQAPRGSGVSRSGAEFQSTRRSFITQCERTGVPEHFTASLVGHRSARPQNKLTYGIYLGGISEEQKRCIACGSDEGAGMSETCSAGSGRTRRRNAAVFSFKNELGRSRPHPPSPGRIVATVAR